MKRMMIDMILRKIIVFFVINYMAFALTFGAKPQFARHTAREIQIPGHDSDLFYFSLPSAIDYDPEYIFILDAQDCEVRVFSKSGAFKYSFGRKGQGPGEFDLPHDIHISGERIYISDAMNQRIQVLDKTGNFIKTFRVQFYPQKILVLGEGRIIVTRLLPRSKAPLKIIHCLDTDGKVLWESFNSYYSGDSVYDFLRNQVFLKKNSQNDFFLIQRSGERLAYHLNIKGEVIRKIKISDNYPVKKIEIPLEGGKKRPLSSVCWNCALNNRKFFFLIPEYSEEGDLIAGKQMAILGWEGSMLGMIDFPETLRLFAVDQERIFAVDSENKLRFFEIPRK